MKISLRAHFLNPDLCRSVANPVIAELELRFDRSAC